MPRPVGYGRPGTKVIPDGWQESAAKVVESTFDCTVQIGPPGATPTWNEGAKATLSSPAAAAYDGPATITPLDEDGEQQTVVAEDQVPLRRYQVKIRHAAGAVEVGHVVTVAEAPDAALTGRRLEVTAVEMGSRRFSRILTAVDAD